MRRISLIVLCLLLAGAIGATAAASAPRSAQHKRQKLCRKHVKHLRHLKRSNRLKRLRRCQRRQRHNVVRAAGDRQPSDDAPTPLPPLPELIAPETDCPGQSDESLSSASQEATMACMINFARSRAGAPGLAGVGPLTASSGDKVSDIIGCNEFSHTACGRPFTYWFQEDGYMAPGDCWGAGENIAWGTGELGTVRSIFTGWVNSPDHLDNMLSDSFDQFGVGMQVGSLNGYPDAHVWVTHFGVRC